MDAGSGFDATPLALTSIACNASGPRVAGPVNVEAVFGTCSVAGRPAEPAVTPPPTPTDADALVEFELPELNDPPEEDDEPPPPDELFETSVDTGAGMEAGVEAGPPLLGFDPPPPNAKPPPPAKPAPPTRL